LPEGNRNAQGKKVLLYMAIGLLMTVGAVLILAIAFIDKNSLLVLVGI
jgi:hypothetical protein